MTISNRDSLRKALRQKRAALASDVRWQHALAVRDHLVDANVFDSCQQVACYWATKTELSLQPTIEHLSANGIDTLLPIVRDQELMFAPWRAGSRMVANEFGILEPIEEPTTTLGSGALVLVPLVGFSPNGHRLGQGGGYYDRLLGNRPELKAIGIAHAVQKTLELQPLSHDVRLHSVVTEQGFAVRTAEFDSS